MVKLGSYLKDTGRDDAKKGRFLMKDPVVSKAFKRVKELNPGEPLPMTSGTRSLAAEVIKTIPEMASTRFIGAREQAMFSLECVGGARIGEIAGAQVGHGVFAVHTSVLQWRGEFVGEDGETRTWPLPVGVSAGERFVEHDNETSKTGVPRVMCVPSRMAAADAIVPIAPGTRLPLARRCLAIRSSCLLACGSSAAGGRTYPLRSGANTAARWARAAVFCSRSRDRSRAYSRAASRTPAGVRVTHCGAVGGGAVLALCTRFARAAVDGSMGGTGSGLAKAASPASVAPPAESAESCGCCHIASAVERVERVEVGEDLRAVVERPVVPPRLAICLGLGPFIHSPPGKAKYICDSPRREASFPCSLVSTHGHMAVDPTCNDRLAVWVNVCTPPIEQSPSALKHCAIAIKQY